MSEQQTTTKTVAELQASLQASLGMIGEAMQAMLSSQIRIRQVQANQAKLDGGNLGISKAPSASQNKRAQMNQEALARTDVAHDMLEALRADVQKELEALEDAPLDTPIVTTAPQGQASS